MEGESGSERAEGVGIDKNGFATSGAADPGDSVRRTISRALSRRGWAAATRESARVGARDNVIFEFRGT